MKKLRTAILGCGRIGSRHAEKSKHAATLIAVCDILSDRANSLAKKNDCTAFTSIDSFLAFCSEQSVDIVAVCTPNGLHCEHAIAALRSNLHVLCEKPMALTFDDCQRMNIAAAKALKRLYVVKQNRFNEPVQKVKEVIEQGALGRISNVQLNCFWNRNSAYFEQDPWKGTFSLDGGTLFTQFSHFLDLMVWLLGEVRPLKATRNNFFHKDLIEFEDGGVALIEFENGAIGAVNYSICSFEKNFEGSLTILGEKGTIKIGGQYLNELEYFHVENWEAPVLNKVANAANEYGHYQGSMSNHEDVYSDVLKALHSNEEATIPEGVEASQLIKLIEGIYSEGAL